jgi:hypothetical protein
VFGHYGACAAREEQTQPDDEGSERMLCGLHRSKTQLAEPPGKRMLIDRLGWPRAKESIGGHADLRDHPQKLVMRSLSHEGQRDQK